jgi:pyruvate kinase
MPHTLPHPPSTFDLDLNHKYLHFRRTKIVATIGPASSSPEKIKQLLQHGLNVVRINFSHGEPADQVKTIALVRKIAASRGKSVAVLGDLCGPKIRVGMFPDGAVTLREKSRVIITTREVLGTASLIPSQYKGIVKEVALGDPILLDDGNLELKVTRKLKDTVEAVVIRGGVLKNHKGMNLPGTKMKISALTAKDKNDVLYCIKAQVDYLALSFVRQARDVQDLRSFLAKHNVCIPIIAKIEKPEALQNIEAIIDLADGIMVARGDLGVELPTKKVPLIQNKLIQLANQHNKPVIVATQMLESMIEHSRPTRAEVTDVAGACTAGADAVMLSAETAAGRYPVEAVAMMDSILRETEAYVFFSQGGKFKTSPEKRTDQLQNALGAATALLSRDLMVHSVFVLTRRGVTAQVIAADRPAAPIIAFTPLESVARKLNLYWGVYPYVLKKELNLQEYTKHAEGLLHKLRLAKKGDYIILLSGQVDKHQATNSLLIHQIG